MSVKTETRMVEEEVTIYHCDLCEKRIGPAPIDLFSGYMVGTTVQARDDHRPLWFATVCRKCIDGLRERSGFDARS